MSRWSVRRERFRAVLSGDKCVFPGSVFDPVSARIAADLGFEVGMFAGSIASLTVLGAPDLIVLTFEAVHRTSRAPREGTPPERLEGVAGDALMKQVMRNADYARWMKDWS